jgi:hypothetical protein
LVLPELLLVKPNVGNVLSLPVIVMFVMKTELIHLLVFVMLDIMKILLTLNVKNVQSNVQIVLIQIPVTYVPVTESVYQSVTAQLELMMLVKLTVHLVSTLVLPVMEKLTIVILVLELELQLLNVHVHQDIMKKKPP